MEYLQSTDDWERDITTLQETIHNVRCVPPLIIHDLDGTLSVRDGNHRLEAFQRLGWRTCWVIIWYDTEEAFLRAEAAARSADLQPD